jgi:hypothetical protein
VRSEPGKSPWPEPRPALWPGPPRPGGGTPDATTGALPAASAKSASAPPGPIDEQGDRLRPADLLHPRDRVCQETAPTRIYSTSTPRPSRLVDRSPILTLPLGRRCRPRWRSYRLSSPQPLSATGIQGRQMARLRCGVVWLSRRPQSLIEDPDVVAGAMMAKSPGPYSIPSPAVMITFIRPERRSSRCGRPGGFVCRRRA